MLLKIQIECIRTELSGLKHSFAQACLLLKIEGYTNVSIKCTFLETTVIQIFYTLQFQYE